MVWRNRNFASGQMGATTVRSEFEHSYLKTSQ